MAMHVLLAEMARAGRCRRMHWNDWYPLYKLAQIPNRSF
jgi:hypothetical protein